MSAVGIGSSSLGPCYLGKYADTTTKTTRKASLTLGFLGVAPQPRPHRVLGQLEHFAKGISTNAHIVMAGLTQWYHADTHKT